MFAVHIFCACTSSRNKGTNRCRPNYIVYHLPLAPPPDVATDVAEPEAAPKKPVGYVTVAPDKLAQHVNAMVRIRTVSGKRFNGQLVRVSKGTAEVKIRMGGGSATLPVRLADIKDSKVFLSNG